MLIVHINGVPCDISTRAQVKSRSGKGEQVLEKRLDQKELT
jgi:hypothetical protein